MSFEVDFIYTHHSLTTLVNSQRNPIRDALNNLLFYL